MSRIIITAVRDKILYPELAYNYGINVPYKTAFSELTLRLVPIEMRVRDKGIGTVVLPLTSM